MLIEPTDRAELLALVADDDFESEAGHAVTLLRRLHDQGLTGVDLQTGWVDAAAHRKGIAPRFDGTPGTWLAGAMSDGASLTSPGFVARQLAGTGVWRAATEAARGLWNGRNVEPQDRADLLTKFLPAITAAANTRPAGESIRTTWEASDLLATRFPEETWTVVDLFPASGLAVLSGPPKQGKSWMALRMAVNVATGTPFLGHSTTAGRVLFLALEDGARRAQRRLRMMPEHTDLIRGVMEIRTAAPALDNGLIGELDRWRTRRSDYPPRLVVIDIWARVKPAGAGKDRYAEDYAGAAGLQKWANQHGISVLVLHHNRKPVQGDDDPFMAVSGTTGLTGAVDVVMVLRGSRGSPEAALFIAGRDVEQQEVSLRLTRGGLWEFGSMPIDMVVLPARLRWDRDVWRYLAENGPHPTSAIAQHFKLSEPAVLKRLRRVEEVGWIISDGKPSPGQPVFWQAVTEQPPLLPLSSVDSVTPERPVSSQATVPSPYTHSTHSIGGNARESGTASTESEGTTP